jgi:hypothetical protein
VTNDHNTGSRFYDKIKQQFRSAFIKGDNDMKESPISGVTAREDGILQVCFNTGNLIFLNMKPKFNSYRFGILSNTKIFLSAVTDGNFIRWYKDKMVVAELGFREIIKWCSEKHIKYRTSGFA